VRYTEPITLVGAFFLFFSLVAAALVRSLEAMLSLPGKRS
jgi:polar amino acid transport system permease protein